MQSVPNKIKAYTEVVELEFSILSSIGLVDEKVFRLGAKLFVHPGLYLLEVVSRHAHKYEIIYILAR